MNTEFKGMAIAAMAVTLLASCNKEDPNAISLSEISNGIEAISAIGNTTYDVVDLGLPSKTLWATCNVGAGKPQESGDLVAWGELETKSSYDWTNYKHRTGDANEAFDFTKYVQESTKGYLKKADGKTRLDSIDDIAAQRMGGKWRTPTPTQVSELLLRTTPTLCTLEGVWGYKLTSTEKGYEDRSIFLPLCGKADGTNNHFIGKYGFYWISDLYGSKTDQAQCLWLDNKDGNTNVVKQYLDRYAGLPVRPVVKK